MLLELVENSEATSVEEEPIHLYCSGCYGETGRKITFCGVDDTDVPDSDCGPEDECAMCVWVLDSLPKTRWGEHICKRGHYMNWDWH